MTDLPPSRPAPAVRATRTVPMLLGALAAAHVVLALAMRIVPVLGTLHAMATLAVGIAVAARGRRHQVAYAIAYIAGAEVLWRMTRTSLVWEFGKYAVSAVLFVALMRSAVRRNRGLAIGYLLLLVPSAMLTMSSMSTELARQQISFNLSGPLALCLCVLFFSNIRLTPSQISRVFFALFGPVISIAVISLMATLTAQDLEFTRQSNSVTSGGFGPNQVSAMLGLGLLFAVLMLFERNQPWRIRGPLLALTILFAAQSALTFSRGGLVLAIGGVFVACLYLIRDRRARVTLVILAALMFAVGKYAVVPRLEAFTQGRLSERYTSTKTSNRDVFATWDIEIFMDNPVLGVGPGVASQLRRENGLFGAAHTEFTRMLAEHGILGGLAVVLLGLLGFRTLKAAKTLRARAFVAAMLVWFTLFLTINAMRVVAPMFVFGLACAIAVSSQRPRSTLLSP